MWRNLLNGRGRVQHPRIGWQVAGGGWRVAGRRAENLNPRLRPLRRSVTSVHAAHRRRRGGRGPQRACRGAHVGAGRVCRRGVRGRIVGGWWDATEPLTLPGFRHDVCSAVHPSLVASPFFQGLDLPSIGIVLRQPEVAYAHPLGGSRAAVLYRGVEETASHLGGDALAYRGLMDPLVQWLDRIVPYLLVPCARCPATRWPSAASPSWVLRARATPSSASRPMPPACSSRVQPPTPCSRCQRRSPRRSASSWRLWGTVWGGPWSKEEVRRSRRGWRLSCAGWAASSTRGARSRRWPTCRRHVRSSSTRHRVEFRRTGGRAADAPSRPPVGPLSARPGCLQGRLGPRRAGALVGRGVPADGHGARGWDIRGGGGGEAAVHSGRHADQPFVLVAQPSVVDSPAPRGTAHPVGLLPRAQRIERRHERADRGTDRALRARIS